MRSGQVRVDGTEGISHADAASPPTAAATRSACCCRWPPPAPARRSPRRGCRRSIPNSGDRRRPVAAAAAAARRRIRSGAGGLRRRADRSRPRAAAPCGRRNRPHPASSRRRPPRAQTAAAPADTYKEDDLIGAAEGVFGKGAKAPRADDRGRAQEAGRAQRLYRRPRGQRGLRGRRALRLGYAVPQGRGPAAGLLDRPLDRLRRRRQGRQHVRAGLQPLRHRASSTSASGGRGAGLSGRRLQRLVLAQGRRGADPDPRRRGPAARRQRRLHEVLQEASAGCRSEPARNPSQA